MCGMKGSTMNVVIGPLHPPISTYKPTPIKYAKKDAQSNELQYKATKSYSVRVKKKRSWYLFAKTLLHECSNLSQIKIQGN